jgi:DNA-binding NtrC family response regulator
LVVAGEADVRQLAVTCATGGGWLIETCATGADAVFRLSSHSPDVLVYAEPLPDMPMSQLWRAAGPELKYAVRIHAAAWPALEPSSTRAGDDAHGRGPGHMRSFDVLPRADALDRVLRGLEILVTGGLSPAVSSILDAEDGVWHGMVGTTPVMRDLFGLIRRLAPHVRTALILGEPGSGKETVARVLHRAGPRVATPFVALDCASLGDVASDTFGVPWRQAERDSTWGVFQQVSGGVLFLDAVGELTATAQGRLLSALEARGCGGAGSPGPGPDVHVFAASDRDLRSDVASGRFRRDLFYHLSVVELRVPSLRERRTDIVRLAVLFLQASARRLTHALEGFTEDAEALLTNAPWEGNVRELRSLVERVSLLAEGPLVTAREVLACLPGQLGGAREPAAADRDAVERAQLLAALDDARGNKKAAAERLGLSRRAFYRRLERLAMDDTISRRPGRRLAS